MSGYLSNGVTAGEVPSGISALNIGDGNTSNNLFNATPNRQTYQMYLVGINANALNTDTQLTFPAAITTLIGAASGYTVNRVMFYGASISLTAVQFDVRTAAAGAGTALVDDFAPSALTGATKFVDATLTATADDTLQTVTSLFFRCVVAQGSAATVKAMVEITIAN